MTADAEPVLKFKTETLYWLCDQKLPCQIPQWTEKIKMKISMSTLAQINKAVRYMRFKTHSMQEANKQMLDKALVIQS